MQDLISSVTGHLNLAKQPGFNMCFMGDWLHNWDLKDYMSSRLVLLKLMPDCLAKSQGQDYSCRQTSKGFFLFYLQHIFFSFTKLPSFQTRLHIHYFEKHQLHVLKAACHFNWDCCTVWSRVGRFIQWASPQQAGHGLSPTPIEMVDPYVLLRGVGWVPLQLKRLKEQLLGIVRIAGLHRGSEKLTHLGCRAAQIEAAGSAAMVNSQHWPSPVCGMTMGGLCFILPQQMGFYYKWSHIKGPVLKMLCSYFSERIKTSCYKRKKKQPEKNDGMHWEQGPGHQHTGFEVFCPVLVSLVSMKGEGPWL